MKIFTDTRKWDDIWFRSLSPNLKLIYLYVCDRCDHAGIWEFDRELLVLHTKVDLIDEKEWLDMFYPKIVELPNGKWWIKNYIQFQYPKGINRRTNFFDPVYKSLEKNQIDYRQFEQITLDIPIDNKPSYDDVMKKWNTICEGLPRVSKMNEKRRRLVKKAEKKVVLESLFLKIRESDFLMGKKNDFMASFDWALKDDIIDKIMEGNYDNEKNRRVAQADDHSGGF
jgi:hypothetical protein